MNLLILIYGLLIGSFLNVCIYRIPREESIAFPASHCPNCNTKLKCHDNIPVISYLSLKGKCRYCSEKISSQYPMVESLNGIIYLMLLWHFSFSLDFIFYALISSVLIVISFIDLKEMIIPDSLIVAILILSLIHKALNYFIYGISPDIINSLLGMVIAGGLFLSIVILSRGGMGGGDVTLIASLGFVIGVKYILLTIFLSFLVGSIISIGLLGFKIKTRKDPIPFGPFIIISFFIVLLFGDIIIDIYMRLFI